MQQTHTKAAATPSDKPAVMASHTHARTASHTVEEQPPRRTSDREPALVGYFHPRMVH
jgi:hypothetical protein